MRYDNEPPKHYTKWVQFVSDAMSCYDRELRWIHLPGAGGYYDQDEMIMSIWEAVRLEHIKALNDKEFMELFKNG